jgi:hypothetical protein
MKETQIKITLRFYFTPIRMAPIKNTTNAGKDAEEKQLSNAVGGNVNYAATVESVWGFLKNLKVELPCDPATL